MPRNRKSDSNGSTLATVEPPPISRCEANKLLKQRAQELYHKARADRDERIRQFEAEYGRADRIDRTLLRDLQHLQTRFAAIGARQFKYGMDNEPKVSKFTKLVGELSSHLATERAGALPPIQERTTSETAARSGARDSTSRFWPVPDRQRSAGWRRPSRLRRSTTASTRSVCTTRSSRTTTIRPAAPVGNAVRSSSSRQSPPPTLRDRERGGVGR